jgi:hypothetical protein
MLLVKRLATTLGVAALGWAIARMLGLRSIGDTPSYVLVATSLLGVGLFSSTYDIAIKDVRHNLRVVLTAVTVGVLAKAMLIAAIMYVIFRNPAYIAIGVAVAQIDPLSVAVMRHQTRLSARARTILSAWSAFDDPVTAILAVYLSAVALHVAANNEGLPSGIVSMPNGLPSAGMNVVGNVLLVAGAAAVWALLRWVARRYGREPTSGPLRVAGSIILIVLVAISIDNFLMLGLALVGLFFRPGIGPILRWITPAAFLIATFVLGMVLADGVSFTPGLVLGVAAFGSQVVVGMLVARKLPGDRLRLALSQQSGITAIILALLLETVLPGTVAIVAPAILVVNTIHLICIELLDTIIEEHPRKRNWLFAVLRG